MTYLERWKAENAVVGEKTYTGRVPQFDHTHMVQENTDKWDDCLEREIDGGVELYDPENDDAWIWSDLGVELSWEA